VEITGTMDKELVTLAGWVHELRDIGRLKFLLLRDRKGIIQVTMSKKDVPEEVFKAVTTLSRESVVQVEGRVRASNIAPRGVEIIPINLRVISRAKTPLPMDIAGKVRDHSGAVRDAGLDTRLDHRVIDLRKPQVASIFYLRHIVLRAIHHFFDERNYVEVQTPNLISAASEGGTGLFPVQYFEKKVFLAQSPQLYKQMLMATGFDRVYEVTPYFRAEEHNTVRHLNELTGVDAEIAYISSEEEVMTELEELLSCVVDTTIEVGGEYLEKLGVELTPLKTPLPRLTYKKAVELLQEEGYNIIFGEDLDTKAEKILGRIMMEKTGCKAYFITRFPSSMSKFYTQVCTDDPDVSTHFDLEYGGMEVASGNQRVHDMETLKNRIISSGLNIDDFSYYLEAFEFGMPPHGGFGLGLDRLLMQLLKLGNIREATLFPRDRDRVTP